MPADAPGGRRVAELLASEVAGLSRGGLGALSVADADRDAEPDPEGAFAYAVDRDDGVRVATVWLYPDRARVAPTDDAAGAVLAAARERDLPVESDPPAVVVESGAAVKRAARALAVAGERES